MKKMIIIIFTLVVFTTISFGTTYTIVNSGFTFSPSNLTINMGDTVNFILSSIHTAREVNQATWDANGTTSNGGFDLPNSGGTIVLNQTGTYYYVCVPHASLGMKGTITVNTATEVKQVDKTAPNNFVLMQNYPNPFNPTTTISFSLPAKSFVSLAVFNAQGKEVSMLINEELSAGYYSKKWNGMNLSSGVYYYRLEAGQFIETKKLILLK
ncbi:MAG: T9SS type A sorting domain-containing protein [Ignavibacteriaceae bacterium]|nr:T9SS type A sorting domain-containing protein [Ignavibacteriaceae bacterium]